MRKLLTLLSCLTLAIFAPGCGGSSAPNNGGGGGGGGGGGTQPLTLSFAPAAVIPSGDNPNKTQTLAVGDFDKDGDDDIATINETTNDTLIFTSNGDGTFTQQAPINVTNTPNAITKGDFNGGGDLDLAVCKANDSMATLPGPTFTPPNPDTAIGVGSKGIFAIDLDGDLDLDLATDNSGTLSLSVIINNGAFNFTNNDILTPTKLANPQGMVGANFNGDTRNDLAVANGGGDNVRIFFNKGGAAATLFSDADADGVTLTLPTGSLPRGLAVDDFNKDTLPDIVVPNTGSDPRSVSVFINSGGGVFAPAVNYTIGTPLTSEPFDAAVSDFNLDGNRDIAITDATAIKAVVLLGKGDAAGTFQNPQPFNANSVATPLTDIRSIGVGDFNKDGKPDIVAASSNQNNLSILINTSQ